MQLTFGPNRHARSWGILAGLLGVFLTWLTWGAVASADLGHGLGLTLALFWLIVLAYLLAACWGFWGRETIAISNGVLRRERHLFDARLSVDEFDVSEIRDIVYAPLPKSWAWHQVYMFPGPKSFGVWLGDIAFQYQGRTVRIVEGLDWSGFDGEELVRRLERAVDAERGLA